MRAPLLQFGCVALATLALSVVPVSAAPQQQPGQPAQPSQDPSGQSSSPTPQPQQGDSSSSSAPPQSDNSQPGATPDKPKPQPAGAKPAGNDDGPQWSSSKKDDAGAADPDDSTSSSKKKTAQPDDSDANDGGNKPRTSKAKAGVLAPESDPSWDPFHAAQDIDVGKFYMDKGDYDAAITRFEDAIRLRANFAKPRALIAEAYEKKGDKESALRYYKEYLQVLPNASDAKKIQKKIDQLSSK